MANKESHQFVYEQVKDSVEDIMNLAPYSERANLIDRMLEAKHGMFKTLRIPTREATLIGAIAMIDARNMDDVILDDYILGEIDGQEIGTN